jgi:hypothetical protein
MNCVSTPTNEIFESDFFSDIQFAGNDIHISAIIVFSTI